MLFFIHGQSQQVKMMVVLGELGRRNKCSLVEALQQGTWLVGFVALLSKYVVQFRHADEMKLVREMNTKRVDPLQREILVWCLHTVWRDRVAPYRLHSFILYLNCVYGSDRFIRHFISNSLTTHVLPLCNTRETTLYDFVHVPPLPVELEIISTCTAFSMSSNPGWA